MPIVIERLERTLSRIGETDDGPFRHGVFPDLGGDLHYQIAVQPQPNPRQRSILRTLQYVARDVMNIETLIDRINWQQELWSSDRLTDRQWNVYTTADIDLFHVEFRSLFDYLARLICAVADKPDQVQKDSSFETLSNWAGNPDKNPSDKLGDDLVALIKSADWFPLIRTVRNNIIHYGAETFVFYEKPRVLFQTYTGRGWDKIIDLPELMYNANVVDFELYVGVFYGYLIDYLEDVARAVYSRLGLTRREGSTRHHNPGIVTARRWIDAAYQTAQRTTAAVAVETGDLGKSQPPS